MATYSERKLKSGKLVFDIQVPTKDELGITHWNTIVFRDTDGLSPKQAERAAHAFGDKWERELKAEKPDYNEFEDYTFLQMANLWLKMKSPIFSENHKIRARQAIEKMQEHFNGKPFRKITAFDVQKFFNYLSTHKITKTSAVIKEHKMKEFDTVVKEYGIHKAERDGITTRCTLYYVRKGQQVEWITAKTICESLGLNTHSYFDKITTEHGYAQETIEGYKRILSAIFTYAMSIGVVHKNLASSAYVKDYIGGEKAKPKFVLTDDEVDRLLGVLDNHEIQDTLPIYLALVLGIRKCELCGINWSDIDFDKNRVHIQRNRLYISHKGIIEKGTKTAKTKNDSSNRYLPVVEPLRSKLLEYKEWWQELKDKEPEFSNCDAVFCDFKGNPRNPDFVNIMLKKYLLEADCKLVSPHKLRHTMITRLISHGVAVNMVAKLAGHSKADTTIKVYTQYVEDIEKETTALENLFSKKQA